MKSVACFLVILNERACERFLRTEESQPIKSPLLLERVPEERGRERFGGYRRIRDKAPFVLASSDIFPERGQRDSRLRGVKVEILRRWLRMTK